MRPEKRDLPFYGSPPELMHYARSLEATPVSAFPRFTIDLAKTVQMSCPRSEVLLCPPQVPSASLFQSQESIRTCPGPRRTLSTLDLVTDTHQCRRRSMVASMVCGSGLCHACSRMNSLTYQDVLDHLAQHTDDGHIYDWVSKNRVDGAMLLDFFRWTEQVSSYFSCLTPLSSQTVHRSGQPCDAHVSLNLSTCWDVEKSAWPGTTDIELPTHVHHSDLSKHLAGQTSSAGTSSRALAGRLSRPFEPILTPGDRS
ncbi:hypothetical protein M409DRAFT_61646 [Zasmidium cellare ATCC 36951]|uniref:Uncharacterized protein n=1 Tax=Zasmidium cellare ATCC 36951 TaxID=1080233 RepID=A0A6A6BV92_ZASCE|nr:uncharacterized protein M409DRAFT_61646 [Zasmidium cellare ATCC 36951]KAF2158443.1 hypothetical protein M409DRAFT_61646 [Zasmidium cellare ATCC 36951]